MKQEKSWQKLADEHMIITDCEMKMIPGESVSLWDTYNFSPSVEQRGKTDVWETANKI